MKPTIHVVYGYPAAGKTTTAKQLEKELGAVRISADDIRYELYGSQDCYGDPVKIYGIALARLHDYLSNGLDVIYDTTNLRKDDRRYMLSTIADIECRKVIYIVDTDRETCIQNHINRDRSIALENLLPYFNINEPPTYDEGWDNIETLTWPDRRRPNSET